MSWYHAVVPQSFAPRRALHNAHNILLTDFISSNCHQSYLSRYVRALQLLQTCLQILDQYDWDRTALNFAVTHLEPDCALALPRATTPPAQRQSVPHSSLPAVASRATVSLAEPPWPCCSTLADSFSGSSYGVGNAIEMFSLPEDAAARLARPIATPTRHGWRSGRVQPVLAPVAARVVAWC